MEHTTETFGDKAAGILAVPAALIWFLTLAFGWAFGLHAAIATGSFWHAVGSMMIPGYGIIYWLIWFFG